MAACVCVVAGEAAASNVGRRLPPERKTVTDPVTGRTVTFLTTDPASDSKPYQTHTTWTADGRWILFRADRGGGGQAYAVNEETGDIVQLTDGPGTGTGSLNLSRKANRLYYMRGGPSRRRPTAEAAPPTPRQLIELELDPLLADAMRGAPKEASAYERVVATLPDDLRDAGGFGLDADETAIYWGVTWGAPPEGGLERRFGQNREPGGGRSAIDDPNMDPQQPREANRRRFEASGKGPGGIRSIDVRTGEIRTVIDVDLRMGHVQANPWVPGEIIYCHETTGDAPQRIWTVKKDGTGNRPLYVETADEWVTHETVAGPDEVMFNVLGHLPYLRERPSGIGVVNLRNGRATLLGQLDEDLPGGRTGGFWHCNGSPDGRWAVGDTFKGDIYLIDRRDGRRILLTTDHKMKPDHAHPIFSPDSRRVLIQSGQLTDGRSLDLAVVEVPSDPAR